MNTDSEKPRNGYYVSYNDGAAPDAACCGAATDTAPNAKYTHVFCGENDTRGAWCPNCDKPLLRFLDLDTGDPRLEISWAGTPRLPLLYCWSCNVHAIGVFQDEDGALMELKTSGEFPDLTVLSAHGETGFSGSAPFMYRVGVDGAVSLVQYAIGGCKDVFAYPNGYPLYFPAARAALLKLSDDVANAIFADNRDDYKPWQTLRKCKNFFLPQHQIGGEPILSQKDVGGSMVCPGCNDWMPRFASVADDNASPLGFVDDISTQVLYHLCRSCRIVGCFNHTD